MNPRSRWHRAGVPIIWAHRGDSAHVVENTLGAFRRAREVGADGVELDVRLTGDGRLVVFHDDDLRRLAGRGEAIDKTTYARLREVRLDGGEQVPTLDEVFEVVGPDLLVNVEIKSTRLGGAGRTVELALQAIDRAGAADRVIISSFDPFALVFARRRAPAIARGMLFHRGEPLPIREAWIAPLVAPSALHPESVLCDRKRIDNWHRRGYAINAWTVDDPKLLATLARVGIDGIFTNDPGLARATLGKTR